MGFVTFVTGTCIAVYILTLVASGPDIVGSGLFSFLGPNWRAILLFGASGPAPVIELHRWWTVLSATWLHAGLLHILFNLMWIRQLAPAVGELYGPGRMVVIYTVGGIVGFSLSTVVGYQVLTGPLKSVPFIGGAPMSLGASAAIFGLLGALVYYGRRTGSSVVRGQATSWAVGMFVFGLVMPGVDNMAHAGGFIGGYLAGVFFDPLRPERVTHLLWALVCLVLSVLSILVSVITGLPLVRGG